MPTSHVPGTGQPPHRPDGSTPAPTADDLTHRILTLPDVALVVADKASGAPPATWGYRFFFVGPDRRRPFATIGEHDLTGFDEDSHLDRPGVYRLNLELGRAEFERHFGYPPAQFPDHRPSIDFTALDQVLPHPVYGTHGWACVLNPGPRSLTQADKLLTGAHDRALRRHHRAHDRRQQPG